MEWDSPWGKGFPGWHIECSAMSMKYLGETLDIHAGGIDHIPVHHTNEIAQSEASTGKQFSRYWMHSNHITIEGEKISKSLGNGITLEDIEAKGISLDAFRLHVLESHYRSQSKFSWDSLEAASNRLRNWQAAAALRWQTREQTDDSGTIVLSEVSVLIRDALSDDLNTPIVLALLSNVFEQVDIVLVPDEQLQEFVEMLVQIDALLGLHLSEQSDISGEQKKLISSRHCEISSQLKE
jgi:cysteinyl-tRNA synthetase